MSKLRARVQSFTSNRQPAAPANGKSGPEQELTATTQSEHLEHLQRLQSHSHASTSQTEAHAADKAQTTVRSDSAVPTRSSGSSWDRRFRHIGLPGFEFGEQARPQRLTTEQELSHKTQIRDRETDLLHKSARSTAEIK